MTAFEKREISMQHEAIAKDATVIAPTEALDQLLSSVGLSRQNSGANVTIFGEDPIVPSPHRLGTATSVALAAQGVAIAQIWQMQTGRTQDVAVDMRDGVFSLDSVNRLRQNGHPVDNPTRRDPASNMFRTRDGRWIFVIGSFPHHRDGVLDLLRCWNNPTSIRNAISQWDAFDLETAAADRGLPVAAIRTADEWRRHPQGQLLAGRPVVEIERIGDSRPEPVPGGERPLSGLRVLDMTHVIAGPVVARTLAEQGADVLHVRSSRDPDPLLCIMDVNHGKRSAFMDFGNADDESAFAVALAGADVFCESWRPGSLERHGISPERAASIRPGIIYTSVSCYGADGPWATRGGFDQLGQSVSGIAATEGALAAPRLVPTYLLNDYLSAYLAALGTLAALIRRAREGGSYRVHVSLTGSSMWVQSLGLIPQAELFGRTDQLGTPTLAARDTAWGRLEFVGPVTRFSETKAYWALPPQPSGTSLLTWTPSN
jgi:crotonobetainyl-CoA:carnitine CoA-transferase CaiB-like acyl-CoA transferase